MRGLRWSALAVLLAASGCQSGPSHRTIASTEPTLTAPGEPGTTVVEAPPPKTITWSERHPLFTKPRQYYDSSGSNKVVKVAAGTLIGIPAGVFGELRQIVVGRPPDPRY